MREALRVERIEKWQEDALTALVNHDRLAIRSGHGVGKSTLLSWAVLWWLLTHYPAKVACTAPTAHQLEDVLWSELSIWYRRLPDALQGLLDIKSDRVTMTEDPEGSYAVARTARKENPEALQGFHSRHMLFLIDECPGVDDTIFEVAQGAMSTSGAKTVMTGNPTRTSGYFFDAFHEMSNRWWTRQVSCVESNLVSSDYVEEIAQKYGTDSNVYRIRVLGEFPLGDDDSVIPLHLVEAAVKRDIERPKVEDIFWGVDVARFGSDRSSLAKRTPTRLLEPVKSWHGKDIMEVSGIIKHEWDTCHGWERPQAIFVDVIGYGAGVADRLRELGLPVCDVNVAELPGEENTNYLRLRDELWFKARQWFDDRSCWIPNDKELIAELVGTRYQYMSAGKIKVETKEEMKKRSRKSPDLADAFCLTFGKLTGRLRRKKPGFFKTHANSSYSPHRWRRRA